MHTLPKDCKATGLEEGETDGEEFGKFCDGAREDNVVLLVVCGIVSECFRPPPEHIDVRETERFRNALHGVHFLPCCVDTGEVVLWHADCKWEEGEAAAGPEIESLPLGRELGPNR